MNLHEYQAKELLKKYNVPVQDGIGDAYPWEACGKIPFYTNGVRRRFSLSAQVGDALDVAGMAYGLPAHPFFPSAAGRL